MYEDMKIGPKYKIARRLGAAIFEKTQSPKFVRSTSRRSRLGGDERPRSRSEFGVELLEKQRARMLYGIGERQFSKYAEASLGKKGANSAGELFRKLEMRLDNVIYRLGLAGTRRFGRQMASHGHFTVNGKRVTIPSFEVKVGDKIGVRGGSRKGVIFSNLEERLKGGVPPWMTFDTASLEAQIVGVPTLTGSPLIFDIERVLDFYRR